MVARHKQDHCLGLGLEATPEVALQTARALAGDAPLVLFVPLGTLLSIFPE